MSELFFQVNLSPGYLHTLKRNRKRSVRSGCEGTEGDALCGLCASAKSYADVSLGIDPSAEKH